MKKIVSALLLCCLLINISFAQNAKRPSINNLHIKWEIVQNYYQNSAQSLTALTFSARNNWSLLAKGWKIYFSFAAEVTPNTATGNVDISHVNGDLFCISPKDSFTGIKAGDSVRVAFVSSDWAVNFTDAPAGFYLVWDNAPQQAYALKNISLKPSTDPRQLVRSPEDKVPVATPQSVFEQNENIRNIPVDSLCKIFPTPDSYQTTHGNFSLIAGVRISADPAFTHESFYLHTELSKLLVAVLPKKTRAHDIKLIKKDMAPEAYELTVAANGITIAASTGAGVFYGIQSLKTLIPAPAYGHQQKSIVIPCVSIADKPRFAYRAVSLDVARNFQPESEVLKLLDAMALYKLNIFHIHLTDDEGWRLEIPSLPELTDVGSKRGHTTTGLDNLQPGLGSGPFVNASSGSGYYSRADFIEILKYATARHISVVPEIESPGHARAAVKSMYARYKFYSAKGDEAKATEYLLNDLKDSSEYSSVQFYNDNVINMALPSTYKFIGKITDEIVSMYAEAGAPLRTIHYGGDETPEGILEKSPAFLSLKRSDTSIKTTDNMWQYYYIKVNNILKAHQLYLTAWEEAGSEKVLQNGKKVSVIDTALSNKNVHLEVWNNILGGGSEDLAYRLANNGFKVILSCVTNLYFDMAYQKTFDEPGYYWGGYADLNKPFEFIPLDYLKNATHNGMGALMTPAMFAGKEKLTAAGRDNIVGLQGALWEETVKSTDRMEYMIFPRLLGLAERAWAKDPDWATETDTTKSRLLFNGAWSEFVNVLGKRELPRLDHYSGGFNYRIPSPGAVIINGQVAANVQLPGLHIHYTTNGTVPTFNSPVYKAPLAAKGIIKMAVFNSAGRAGKVITIKND